MSELPQPARCPSCGAALASHWERCENVCSDLKCRGRWLQERSGDEEARERVKRDALIAHVRDLVARQHPEFLQDGPPRVLMIVPSFVGEVTPQSEGRKRKFRDNLKAAMSAAEVLAANPQKRAQTLTEHEHRHQDPSPLAVINACSTCRGQCCRQGEDHAFLTPTFLAWRLTTEPDQTPESIVEDYVNRLPDEALTDSCLYHTPTGCELPRSIRSSTCNDFHCAGIVHHYEALRDNPDLPTIAVAAEDGRPQRMRMMDAVGQRIEHELQQAYNNPLCSIND